MRFRDDVGCALTRGTTGRKTEYLTARDAEDETLIKDWVQNGGLGHPGAERFLSLIADLNAGTADQVLFRGRFRAGDMVPCPSALHFGPPPPDLAKAGRYNAEGRPVLYLSTTTQGVVRELRSGVPPIDLFCQEYRIPSGRLKMADFSNPEVHNFLRIAFDYAEQGIGAGGRDDRSYRFSQAVAVLVEAAGYEGMIVPGVRGTPNARYCNVVVFSVEGWNEWLTGNPYRLEA